MLSVIILEEVMEEGMEVLVVEFLRMTDADSTSRKV
jgi:hypothetical protein